MKTLLTRIPRIGAIGLALLPYATVLVASSLDISLHRVAAVALMIAFTLVCCLVAAFAVRRSDVRLSGVLTLALMGMNGLLILGQGCSPCSSKGVGH